MAGLRVWLLGLLTLVVVLGLSVSGPAEAERPQRMILLLEWFPNPDHLPIYVAQEKGFFQEEGLQVEIQVPADPSAVAKLGAVGQADLVIVTELNLLIVRSEGLPLVAVAALVQHPLSMLLALKESGIETLADLKGRKIGYSMEPLEPVLYRAMLATVGLEPGDYELVNVGFNLVPALLTGVVDAIGAFIYEKVKLELEGYEVVAFPFQEHGIPDYYELLFASSERTIAEKAELINGFVRAMEKAHLFTLAHPDEAMELFFQALPDQRATPELEELNRAAFAEIWELFAGSPCHNDPTRWEGIIDFMFQNGLIAKRFPLEELMTEELLPRGCLRF